MMTYEMFKEVFTSEFKNYLPDEWKHFEVHVTPTQKVNKTQDSLSMVDPDMEPFKMGPSISISDFYKDYLVIEDLNEVLSCAANVMVEGYKDMPQYVSGLDFSAAKDNIVFELINTKKNEELLKGIPHREVEDLSVIYRWIVSTDEEAIGGVIINEALVDKLGLCEEELYLLATKNTHELLPPKVRSMENIMKEMMVQEGVLPELVDLVFDEHPANMMYVITNENGLHGAASMLYDEPLQEVAEIFQEDLYILPSSCHEVIVVPRSMGEPEYLSKMVKEINTDVVHEEDFLSDNVYVYDKTARSISMATGRESLLDQIKDAKKELDTSVDKTNQVQRDLGLAH